MSTIRGIVVVAVAMLAVGCGARTGLIVGDAGEEDGFIEEDASAGDVEPEAPFGPFPCTYGRSGEPVPVDAYAPWTVAPAIAWGSSSLGAAFWRQRSDGPWGPWALVACTARIEDGLECSEASDVATVDSSVPEPEWSPQLAWSGSGYGLCWQTPTGARFQQLDSEARPVGEPTQLDFEGRRCLGLEWVGDRFMAVLGAEESRPPRARWAALDPSGALIDAGDIDVPPHAADGLRLAADSQHAVVTIARGGEVELRDLLGSFERQVPARPLGPPSAALREGKVGLLWLEDLGGDAAEGRFVLVDLVSGEVEEDLVLPSGDLPRNAVLHAVWDGFLAAWVEIRGGPGPGEALIVTPVRDVGVPALQVRRPVDLFAGVMFVRVPWFPALADDGHVAFVAATFSDPTRDGYEVHLQLLGCHR